MSRSQNNIFNTVKVTAPQTSVFDLSHDVKLSCNMGDLVPIMVLDCLPGDRFNISNETLLRFQPLVAPVMHRYDVFIHYFFTPDRLGWANFEKWITNTKLTNGNLPAHPYVDVEHTGANYTKLADYMGVPDPLTCEGADTKLRISPMAFAAYQRIFNEYYRDQNLSPEIPNTELADGDNTGNMTSLFTLRRRAWEHDYFTSALPFAQKGDTVDIPLGEVQLNPNWFGTGINPAVKPRFLSQGNTYYEGYIKNQLQIGQQAIVAENTSSGALAYDPNGSLEVQSTTINDLRTAYKLQEWLEKNARGGTRYTESNRMHFGVTSPDARLQRPEYITGTKSPVVISEVLNATGTDDLPQGNMAGHGVSVTAGQNGSYYCQEHGYIIGIMSILPRTAYYQGVPKHFKKYLAPTQKFWPSFANIGEQPITDEELFAYQSGNEASTFGYIPRYAEYKYLPSRVAGDFKTTLDFWQHARKFNATPALNQQFIEAAPDTRIFAVQDETDKLLVHVYNKVRAVRPMPKYGTPQF